MSLTYSKEVVVQPEIRERKTFTLEVPDDDTWGNVHEGREQGNHKEGSSPSQEA